MKRFISILLTVAVICTSVVLPVMAATDSKTVEQPKSEAEVVLTDLGIIDKYNPDAYVTRGDVTRFLDIVKGEGAYVPYFGNEGAEEPVSYGQVLMVLVDITGYTSLMDNYGLDPKKEQSYYQMAVKARIPVNGKLNKNGYVKMSEYAELIWSTMTDVDVVKTAFVGDGYNYIDDGSNLLNVSMRLAQAEGVLNTSASISLDTRVEADPERIVVGNTRYFVDEKFDTDQYIGRFVNVIVDKRYALGSRVVSIYAGDSRNRVVEIDKKEISSVRSNGISYYKDNKTRKSISFDKPDFVYNNELDVDFDVNKDFKIDDASYRFIDNDGDSKYEVVMVEAYDTFEVSAVIANQFIIVDTDSRTYDLKEYIEDGGKILSSKKKALTFDDISEKNIISYQTSKDGKEYKGFVISAEKVNGIYNSQRKNYEFVKVGGVEYEALASYYKNQASFDKIVPGDEVELFFDFRGKVADVKKIAGNVKAGVVMGIRDSDGVFGNVEMQLLTEKGVIEVFPVKRTVKLNGVNVSAKELLTKGGDFINGLNELKKELILYKQTSDGSIHYIDTPDSTKEGLGSNSNEGFTLDYDYKKHQRKNQHLPDGDSNQITDGRLRTYTMNTKVVIGSRYMADDKTKVFGIDEDRDWYYCQLGTSIATNSSVKIQLYNVDENYWPEYAVIHTNLDSSTWISYPKSAIIADSVETFIDEETGDTKYRLNYYDGKGNYKNVVIYDNDRINTQATNPIMYKSKSLERYRTALKNDEGITNLTKEDFVRYALNLSGNNLANVKKGTVLVVDVGLLGITSYGIQFVPGDEEALFFEAVNTITGYDDGDNEYLINGASTMSYGRVMKKFDGGIIINNEQLTPAQLANNECLDSEGNVAPVYNWNRLIPVASSTAVWFYDEDNERDVLRLGTAAEILEGDKIFIHRLDAAIDIIMVCRGVPEGGYKKNSIK